VVNASEKSSESFIKNHGQPFKVIYAVSALFIATSLAMLPIITSVAYADHTSTPPSTYLWSRATADGHRVELSCQSPPNADKCIIPYYMDSSLQYIPGGLTLLQIQGEAINAANTINGMTPYIGVLSQPLTSYWDNKVISGNLGSGSTATFSYDRHCLNWPFCTSKDSHNIKWEIKVNTNSAFNFGTTEVCQGINYTPTKWDLEKVFKHEFYHMLSFDHSGDINSLVYYGGYICTTGNTPTSHDKAAVQAKYPAGVS